MPGSKKIAIFDFDGTIYKYQSPDKFADFIAGNNLRTWILQGMCYIINTRFKQYWVRHKKLKLFKIKGTPLSQLEARSVTFVDQFIANNLIDIVNAELERYINDPEFDVVIASAGYDVYLRHFCKTRNIQHLVATKIEIENNVATGKWIGTDCYEHHKVTRLKEILNLSDYDLKQSVCFSDSMSDKPIFDLVGNKFFVKPIGEEYVINKL